MCLHGGHDDVTDGCFVHAGAARLEHGAESRDGPSALEKRASQRWPDTVARSAQIGSPSQRSDGLPGAIVFEERFAEPRVNLGGASTVTCVLHGQPEHLFALDRVADADAGRAE